MSSAPCGLRATTTRRSPSTATRSGSSRWAAGTAGRDDKGALIAAAAGIVELIKLGDGQEYVAPAGVTLYVEVDDVDALHARLVARDMTAAVPRNRPWGHRQISVEDPDGVTVTFFSPVA